MQLKLQHLAKVYLKYSSISQGHFGILLVLSGCGGIPNIWMACGGAVPSVGWMKPPEKNVLSGKTKSKNSCKRGHWGWAVMVWCCLKLS